MKSARFFILILIGMVVVAGCAGSGPSGVAEQWYEAVATGDGATALKLTCESYQSEVQMAGFLTAGLGLLTGADTDSLKVDLSDVKFTTTSQDGGRATVRMRGEVIVSLFGAAMPQEIDSDLTLIQEGGKWKVCGEY